ncbi:MAG: hypothetical protein IPK83_16140 [Planctomycetes bacterium]|nr:hypothetical protein [Planctomycetota bacterium]
MKVRNQKLWAISLMLLIAPSVGCVSRVQAFDFGRTEFSRLTADLIGQALLIFFQAISPFGAA